MFVQAKEKPTEGRVIATGPGREHPDTGVRMEMPVKVGEGVVYGKYDGSSIKYNDETHTLIRDDDILLFFRGESLSVESAKPCRDHILVRVSSKEDKSMGGLIMAAAVSADKRPDTGIVVKVGKGRQASNGQFMNPGALS
jgi:chaperonin GroES